MAGGIGRFAAGRKKPAQQQQNDASANNDGGGGGEQQPNVNNNNGATANHNNNTTDPTNIDTNTSMEVERPSTAFNSFNNINNADRPATSGSHGFSAINNMMFGGVNDNEDGVMMMDDNNGVDNFGLDNSTAAATEFGQGFSQSFDPMAAAEAAFQDFGGFNTTATDDNNVGEEGTGDGQQPMEGMMEKHGNEKNVEQPVVAEKQPAVASVQEQTKLNVDVGVGGGVGRFAKKRIVNTTTAAAKSMSTTQQQQPSALAVLANAATETATLMSHADKFSPIRNPTDNTTTAVVMNKSVVDNNNSSSDLSRFDIDLMSKNTDNAVGKINGDEAVTNVEEGQKEAAVPRSIRTSGDDVEDDLTEATATTFDGDIFHEAKADEATVGEKESPKTSPYFANVATNNQIVEKMNEEKNAGVTTKTTSPEAAKDADAQTQPSPKLGGNNVMNAQPPPTQTAVQAIPTNTSGANYMNQGSSGAPRVSLSPRPSGSSANVMNQGGDTASSLSPKGMMSRPSQNNTKQATVPTANDEDDNSIVIPGISSAVANNPDFSQQANVVARLSNTIDNVRQQPGSQQQMNNNNRTFQPSSSSSAKGRMISTSLQKPVLNRQKKQPPFMMNRNTLTTSNSCDIVTEKVTFALPKSHPTATNNSNMMMGSNQKAGSSLARAAAAAGSTAITPDSRRVANNNQAVAAATPFGRQSDTSSGSEASSGDDLSPHKDQAFVPTSTTAQPPKKTMVEPRVEDALPPQQQQRRPRSQTITSPPEALMTIPAQSETPKVSNVNQPSGSTMAAASSYHHNNNSAFHTDETFDELLTQFVKDIQDGTDIYEKGQNDLLGLNVDVTHAYSKLLRYKDEYKELLADIEGVQAMAESVMAEISVE